MGTARKGGSDMAKRRWMKVGLLAGAIALVGAGVAVATTLPTVRYQPPTVKVKDHELHMSVEDVVIRRDGKDFTFTNPVSFGIDPASDNGCEFITGGVACPRTGVEKIVVLLNDMNDSADIDLGKSANKVKQILKGQDDNDDLTGGAGPQKLLGGEGNDELFGGPGPDMLDGGPGIDVCIGNSNKDTFKNCEPVPMR